jgi:Ca2+-binding RTX toxin-like protein
MARLTIVSLNGSDYFIPWFNYENEGAGQIQNPRDLGKYHYFTLSKNLIEFNDGSHWIRWEGDFLISGNEIKGGTVNAMERSWGESYGHIRIDGFSYPVLEELEAFYVVTIPDEISAPLQDDESTYAYLKGLKAGDEYYFATPYDTQPVTTAPSQEPQEASSQILNGVVGQADLLTFSGQPAFGIGQADNITNFNPKEGDVLSIPLDEFIGGSRLPKLKIAKNKKGLQKILASRTEFVYDQSTGSLYFNENKALKGFGDGGVFAVLEGAPGIRPSDISFI